MPNYSHSKISSFEQCKLKYKLKYIDKIKVEGGYGIEAFMGSMVHDTLEKLYSIVKTGKTPSLQDILIHFGKKWQEEYNSEVIVIVKEGMKADDYKGMGENFLIHYYNRYKPFDEGLTIGLETQEFLDLDATRKYHVRIDRLTKNGNSYEIHDYKTNSRLPTQDKLDEDRQLAMYSIWVRKRFPDAKGVKLIWHFLAFDTEMKSERSKDALDDIKRDVLSQIEEIEVATDFPPTVTKLCDWCEYQPQCPAWKHKFPDEQKTLDAYSGMDGTELVNKYSTLKKDIDGMSDELDALKDAILKYAELAGVTAVFGTDYKANIRESESISWPAKHSDEREELSKLLKETGLYEKVSDIDGTALGKLIDELDDENKEKIAEFIKRQKVRRMTLSKI